MKSRANWTVALVLLLSIGSAQAMDGGPVWVLVANPRYGTVEARPDDRAYVWVLEDRAGETQIADPTVAREHLPAPGPISSKQRLAVPTIGRVSAKPLREQSTTTQHVDSRSCQLASVSEVPETRTQTEAFWKFPIGGLVGIAIETEKERVRQWEYSNRVALDAYRTCMIERGYEVDGVSSIPKHLGVIGTIEAECAVEWRDDAVKRRECEVDRLDSFRRGILRR